MKEKISILISEERVKQRIAEMAAKISEEMDGESVALICIL